MHTATVSDVRSEERPDHLYGDLTSKPPAERKLYIADLQGLSDLLRSPQIGNHERPIIQDIIRMRTEMLVSELAEAPVFLNALIHRQVHHQLRARPDFQTGKLVIEQWVPALSHWLICGSYEHETPAATIISDLQAGDPRFKTPNQRLQETREAAAAQSARNEQAGADKVAAAVDSMSRKGIADFLAVERAIKTGETIIAHGPDEAYLDRAHDSTITAAGLGDVESCLALAGKLQDTDACVNPGHNPNVR